MVKLTVLGLALLLMGVTGMAAETGERLQLTGAKLRLTWERVAQGWSLSEVAARRAAEWIQLPSPSGRYTVLYINRRAAEKLVERDKEGTTCTFFPEQATQLADGSIEFRQKLRVGELVARWRLDGQYPGDVQVQMDLTAGITGDFSIATPTLAIIEPEAVSWGMVPGNWYGTALQGNFELSPEYSQGIPSRPFLARERNTMTLCPLLSTKSGVTIAAIPDPYMACDPWAKDHNTRNEGRLALSTMDRYGQLAPVVYSPVLGGIGSHAEAGQKLHLGFRYSIQASDWFAVFRHAAMDIYRFPEMLELQNSRESLSDRVVRLQAMLKDPQKSGWRTLRFRGEEIGANGTKTSDVGAMWMLARTSGDAELAGRLPFIRNYKLAQQQTAEGFFRGAATGEYPSEDEFVAERGNWIEPLFTTYYTMLDMGNISLFEPRDAAIRERIGLAAQRLLEWQHDDGSFDVAYDSISHRSAYPQLTDLRPTWYGLLVAWRTLGDERYLAAARRGADWYIREAVEKGHYLGACGDALNVWDFTTAFGIQALLDMHAATGETKYRDAAIRVAQVYATTIFTHPIPNRQTKTVAGVERSDWEISQVGLSVEHIRGTAQSGPILLSSHAGTFVRIYELTGEAMYLDMARAAARGRHHFVDPETGMSIYYWSSLDNVQKVMKLFPWHAEWQVGWITDYLLSEAHLRSGGKIQFPAGFPTPKVGPHVTYGFAPGTIYGEKASLWQGSGAVGCDSADAEYVCALSSDQRRLFVVALNQRPAEQDVTIRVDPNREVASRSLRWSACKVLAGDKVAEGNPVAGSVRLRLPAWGLGVVTFDLPKK